MGDEMADTQPAISATGKDMKLLEELAKALGGEVASDEFQTRLEAIAGRKLGRIYWI